jgi:hypothetical protein
MPTPDPDQAQATPRQPPGPLGEVLAVMLKLGTIAFGGPAVHVAMLREEPSGAGTGWRMRSSWTRSARSASCLALAPPSWRSCSAGAGQAGPSCCWAGPTTFCPLDIAYDRVLRVSLS